MNEKIFTNSEEVRLAEMYSKACDEVRAPKELYYSVVNMEKDTKKDRKLMGTVRKIAVVMAAFVIVVLGSNLVAYAATGTGWIERIFVKFNYSEKMELTFVEGKDSEGNTIYVGYVQDGPNGNTLTVVVYDPLVLQGVSFHVDGNLLFVTDAQGIEHQMKCYDDFDGFTAGLVLVTPLPEK